MHHYFKATLVFFLLSASFLFAQSSNWTYSTMFVKDVKVKVLAEENENAKVTGYIYYLEKVIIVKDTRLPVRFGWARIVFPVRGFLPASYLITPEEKRALDIRFENNPQEELKQNLEIVVRRCKNEFNFVRTKPFNASPMVGILKEGETVLLLVEKDLPEALWVKSLYPLAGYVKRDDIIWEKNNFVLSLGFFYSALDIPYEKNLQKKKNPMGGFITFGRANWLVTPGIGVLFSQSHSEMFLLKTQLYSFFLNVHVLRLFSNHLDFFGTLGGGYWQASFENFKYPNIPEYYPLLKTKGYAYLSGGGFDINFWNLFLGVQYLFWNSPKEAVFGDEPKPGDLTMQYKLFPGSNLINVAIGYRINF